MIKNCNQPHLAKGLCSTHYMRLYRYGTLAISDGRHRRNGEPPLRKTPLYRTWLGMKQRCYNVNSTYYKDYGGRGITICDEWKQDFVSFRDYMGDKPTPQHSIDRINNNGNYEPGNVRWATKSIKVSREIRCLVIDTKNYKVKTDSTKILEQLRYKTA